MTEPLSLNTQSVPRPHSAYVADIVKAAATSPEGTKTIMNEYARAAKNALTMISSSEIYSIIFSNLSCHFHGTQWLPRKEPLTEPTRTNINEALKGITSILKIKEDQHIL